MKPSMLQKKVIFSLCLLMAVSGCMDSRYGAERLFWQAEREFARIVAEKKSNLAAEDYERIIAAYQKVINNYPLESLAVQAHFKISEFYIAQKRFEDAQDELKTIIQNFSSNSAFAAQAQFAIGKIYEIRDNLDLAVEEYAKVSEMYPLTTFGLQTPLYAIQMLGNKKETEKRREIYNSYLKKYSLLVKDYAGTSMAPVIQSAIALAHLLMDEKDNAVGTWDSIIAEYPQSPEAVKAYLAKADFYEKKANDRGRAIAVYEELVTNYPGQPFTANIQSKLGWLYLEKSDLRKAKIRFERIVNDKTSNQDARLNSLLGLSTLFKQQGKKDDVIEVYARIQKDYPRTRVAMAIPFLISQYYHETDDVRAGNALKDAIAEYERIIFDGRTPLSVKRVASHYLVLSYLRDGQQQKALEILQELADNYPDNPGYLLDIAGVYSILKEQDKAIDIYEKLIDKYTNNDYLVSLSRARIKALEEAVPSSDLPLR